MQGAALADALIKVNQSDSPSHLVSGNEIQRRTGNIDNHVLLNLSTSFHSDVIKLRPGAVRLQRHLQKTFSLFRVYRPTSVHSAWEFDDNALELWGGLGGGVDPQFMYSTP